MKRKMEFSKKLALCAMVLNLIVILFSLIMIWRTNDLSPLMYLIPSVAAEVSSATAFYYNKAKAENRIKLMRANGLEPEKDDILD